MKYISTLVFFFVFHLFFPKNVSAGGNPNLFCSPGELNTAVGCVRIDASGSVVEFFVRWGIGVVGGTAILMFIYSMFLMATSGGNPQKVKAAKDLVIAVISGILLLITSVIILRVVGVNILNLPEL